MGPNILTIGTKKLWKFISRLIVIRWRKDNKITGLRAPIGPSTKFPGILKDAYELGTDRFTLYWAITGKRTTKKYRDLAARYEELKRKQLLEASRQ